MCFFITVCLFVCYIFIFCFLDNFLFTFLATFFITFLIYFFHFSSNPFIGVKKIKLKNQANCYFLPDFCCFSIKFIFLDFLLLSFEFFSNCPKCLILLYYLALFHLYCSQLLLLNFYKLLFSLHL